MKTRLGLLVLFLLGTLALPVSAQPPVDKEHYSKWVQYNYNDCDGSLWQWAYLEGNYFWISNGERGAGEFHGILHDNWTITFDSGTTGHYAVHANLKDKFSDPDHLTYTYGTNITLKCADGRTLKQHVKCHGTYTHGKWVSDFCKDSFDQAGN